MRNLLLFTTLMALSLGLKAQDKIYRKNGKIIEVKIKEMGRDEIKYVQFEDQNGPIYVLDKAIINKIEFENGKVQKFSESLTDPEYYIGQKKHAIKLNFLSPIFGYTQFAYEQSIKPGTSFEVGLGIIGLGKNVEESIFNSGTVTRSQSTGAFITGAYKFLKIPQILYGKEHFAHILNGSYLRPEVILGMYGYSYTKDNQTANYQNTYGAVTINVGKQWVLSERFLIDLYGGIGIGFNAQKNNDSYNYDIPRFGVSVVGTSGVAFTGGLRVGYLF